ncbi:hypothetical protein Sjap_023160 [Stephania japonica]|uniref:Pentatricopeptide repeat-containing protein n=1 Tax=Stephania japonica TaxID=461633 RepID=A0AAP0HIR7_9MAGN
MGIKSVSLQMIPWCFHMGGQVSSCVEMSSSSSSSSSSSRRSNIKVIQSDGVVKVYHRPINVSDLMMEFPKHLVCRSDSFTIGQKIPALSEKEKLQLGHNYFLLPKHLFQSALSFVAIASFAASSNYKNKNALLNTHPFIVRKAPSGLLQMRVSDDFISKLIMMQSFQDDDIAAAAGTTNHHHHPPPPPPPPPHNHNLNNNKLCTTAQLEKEYSALVDKSRPCWKPKLETIRESKRRRSLGSFGIKRKQQQITSYYKNTTTHQQQQQQKQIKSSTSTSGSATPPITSKKSSSSSSSSSSSKSKGSGVAAKKKGKKVVHLNVKQFASPIRSIAFQVLDEIPQSDTFTWNTLIQTHIANREIGTSPYSSIIKCFYAECALTNTLVLAFSMLLDFQATSFMGAFGFGVDQYVITGLMELYGNYDGAEAAKRLFEFSLLDDGSG